MSFKSYVDRVMSLHEYYEYYHKQITPKKIAQNVSR